VLLGIVALLLPVASLRAQTKPDVIVQAIAELGSDSFVVREKATERLFEQGDAAIAPLEAASPSLDGEAAKRALSILERLAVESDRETIRANAGAALKRLEQSSSRIVAIQAAEIGENLRALESQQALKRLVQLGAKVDESQAFIGVGLIPATFTLEIGPTWRGETEDLKLLAMVDDLRALNLIGEQVTDEWLHHASAVPKLQSLKVKKAKFSAAGMAKLKDAKELAVAEFLYCPLNDEALRPLAEMPQLSLLRVFGSEATREASQRLVDALPTAKVDIRRGAFLGIGVERHPLGCVITRVEPKSVAARAGLEIGDVIVVLAGERPTDFASLTAIVAKYAPGEEVAIVVYRDSDRDELKVKLGEWE
jgi:hypothetical protein